MFKNHWYWGLYSPGWKEVLQDLRKDFQGTREATPLCMDGQPWMLHDNEELIISGEYVL